MYSQEKELIIQEIEKALLRAYEACRDNIDTTEDLAGFVKNKCQEVRYIERDETEQTRRGDFTNGSCPSFPDVGAKGEK